MSVGHEPVDELSQARKARPSPCPPLPGGVFLTGCHGGAGVSTLAALGLGIDVGARPPRPAVIPSGLFLVARMSASGLSAASTAAEVVINGGLPGQHLLGLIAVAAGPGRPPRIVRERVELVGGWVGRVFRVPWVADLLATDLANVPQCQALLRAIPADLIDLVRSIRGSV